MGRFISYDRVRLSVFLYIELNQFPCVCSRVESVFLYTKESIQFPCIWSQISFSVYRVKITISSLPVIFISIFYRIDKRCFIYPFNIHISHFPCFFSFLICRVKCQWSFGGATVYNRKRAGINLSVVAYTVKLYTCYLIFTWEWIISHYTSQAQWNSFNVEPSRNNRNFK